MPQADNEAIREGRLREGLCPACGTRLYKVVRSRQTINVKALFKNATHSTPSSADGGVKMIPLTLPGVVERGQCMRCSDGRDEPLTRRSPVVPAIKAVPVVARTPAEAYAAAHDLRDEDEDEDLLGIVDAEVTHANDPMHETDQKHAWSDRSCSAHSTDTEYEDVPLLDLASMDLNDPYSSSLSYARSTSTGPDNPDLLEPIPDHAMDSYFAPQEQVANSVDRIRKLREEADQQLSIFETAAPTKPQALDCPDGMSPDVFYQLPPDVQKEVSQHGSTSNSSVVSATDIDPETLASLPENVRREVLDQARKSKQVNFAPDNIPLRKKNGHDRKPLSQSTKVFLSEYDIQEEDFDDLDEDVQRDLLAEKAKHIHNVGRLDKRSDKMKGSLSKSTKQFLSVLDINEEDFDVLDDDVKNDLLAEKQRSSLTGSAGCSLGSSDYDPLTLASLPEDLRNELLVEEKRQREVEERNSLDRRAVGAHSVKVPAGYDPDTFEALPVALQKELTDAANQGVVYSADGYEYDSIVRAPLVSATSVGQETCTYSGGYNSAGKRHGEGKLEWANGNVYIGWFKNGVIEGRGTITFHDGTEYSGQWRNNKFHGEGTRRFKNGNVYNGSYVDGKRHGQGKCYFANGDLYSGDWKNDTIQGFGRYYYNNGHSFEGMFRNGMRNGRGKYQLTDGRVEIYRYVNDSRVGDGVRWSADRKKAWKMNDGKAKRITMEEAIAIANRCGPVLEDS
ncbi:hypothetical protein HJC23_001014 [Cyclotella cryptica]|uniref:MORN repeat-containing protein n=1 Tax=Cyclotella cryptica TaxID=29204 RepID=A0ABD3NY83_9STRA